MRSHTKLIQVEQHVQFEARKQEWMTRFIINITKHSNKIFVEGAKQNCNGIFMVMAKQNCTTRWRSG